MGGYFSAPQLGNLMWITYGGRARKDRKFVENINDVIICLVCCIVEYRLKVQQGIDTFLKFDNKASGNSQI